MFYKVNAVDIMRKNSDKTIATFIFLIYLSIITSKSAVVPNISTVARIIFFQYTRNENRVT